MKKMNHVAIAVMVAVSAVCFVSCEKENVKNPNTGSPELMKTMLQKTNGGAQAQLMAPISSTSGNRSANSVVYSANAELFETSNAQWSANWWKWAMELPLTSNHPLFDDPGFDVTMGQSGKVWYLATPFGNVTRNCTMPSGKPIFVGIINAEASDLEGLGATYAERLATAGWFADHIVPSSLFCTVDGVNVNLSSYRVASPEFNFTAPSPWCFGSTGGYGTSVSDGYFVMVKPLSVGSHTIRIGGAFHFSVAEGDGFDFDASADVTYNITVQ